MRIGYSSGVIQQLHMTDTEQQRYIDLLDDIDRAFEARRQVDMWNMEHALKEALAKDRAEET